MIEAAVLIGLASFRMASLLVQEDGPGLIFERLRTRLGLREGEVKGFLPLLFSCIWCMSVWTTVVAGILWLLEPVTVVILASMTVALFADRIMR